MCISYFFFFFKQKTAYEMRISDWSSDVCSSDLIAIWSASPATTDDDKAWDHMAEEIERLGNAENESWGIEHGYRYAGSPIIAPDGTPEPPFDPDSYRPTTWPGARLPHYYLEDGNALHEIGRAHV